MRLVMTIVMMRIVMTFFLIVPEKLSNFKGFGDYA